MEKITLNIKDILQLEQEISGYTNPETNEIIYKGFIKLHLPTLLKYELMDLIEVLIKEKKKVDEIKNSLIEKYGEKNEQGIPVVKMVENLLDNDGKVVSQRFNPKYLELDKEFGDFLINTEKEIEYPVITKDDLRKAGNTKDNYKILFKLIKKDA